MQLKMDAYQLPEKISFNFDELKRELTEKVEMYKTIVYTEQQITEGKKDRAALNKLKKALNDERIRLEKEYMVPFNEFKEQINEIIRIIDEPILLIRKQIGEYEEAKKAEKLEKIKEYWEAKEKPFAVELEGVMDARWLNSSVALKSVYDAINSTIERFEKDLATLSNLPEFAFEAIETYKTSLDLSKAISEGQRLAAIQKRNEEQKRIAAEQARLKAEAEAQKQEEQLPGQVSFNDAESFDKCINTPVEEAQTKEWVSFSALMTIEDAMELKAFFEARNIQFKPVQAVTFDGSEQYLVSKVFQGYYHMGINEIAEEDETAKAIFSKIELI